MPKILSEKTLSSSLRLGIYSPNYPGVTGEGGIGSYVRRIANALADDGHEIRLLLPGKPAHLQDGPLHLQIESAAYLPIVDRLWPGAGACWRMGNAMLRMVREHHLNIVEFPNWEGLAPWFALRRRVPLVVRLHTSSLETFHIDGLPLDRQRRADVRREQLTARMADQLVTHSQVHQKAMSEELQIDASRIAVIPHGIEPAGKPQVDRDPRTVLYLGRLERRKGTVDLLNAIPLVLQHVPDAKFVLIGADRPHCPGARTHAAFLADQFPAAVQRQITLAGRLPDEEVERWLQRATIFAAPSLYESFGLIFLEAMRWGTPVIGTTAGGIPEIIEDGRSGVLVPPQNPAALAAKIVELLTNEPMRRQIGNNGRQRCESEFSIRRMADRTVNLYSEVIARWRSGTRQK